MTKKAIRPKKLKARVTPREQERIDARAALERGVRRERQIARLSKQLVRSVASANAELENIVRGFAAAQGFELVASEPARQSDE